MMKRILPEIILALDVEEPRTAERLVNELYPRIGIFKVGLQLFTCAGPDIVAFINKKGARVFLDLKFFDIPNTVAGAVREAVRLRVHLLTLHACGGRRMLEAAVNAAREEAQRRAVEKPFLIGVTVLTSMEADMNNVVSLARDGMSAGLDGAVCSVREAERLRAELPAEALIITPGIRLCGAPADDQKRVATVEEAVRAGSNYIVVGRPIVQAANPVRAADELLGALQKAIDAL